MNDKCYFGLLLTSFENSLLYGIPILLLFLISYSLIAQPITGTVIRAGDQQPISYVNIGIPGKSIGTVSDEKGRFRIVIDASDDTDSIQFSIVGYKSRMMAVTEFRAMASPTIELREKVFELSELIIQSRIYKTKTLGVKTKAKKLSAGFEDNLLGYECGILMKVKKTALLRQVNINIASCSYDTLFYRLNIYEKQGDMDFENILEESIYIMMAREEVYDEIQFDLQARDILVEGDFLVTLEHIKSLIRPISEKPAWGHGKRLPSA